MRSALASLLVVALAFGTLGCTQGTRTDSVIRDGAGNDSPGPMVLVAGGAPEAEAPWMQVDEDPAFPQAINAFGLELFRQFASTPGNVEGGNRVISPLSLHMALTMAANGARGETLAEMLEVLRLTELPIETVNLHYASLLLRLEMLAQQDVARLSVANALWPDERFAIAPEFVSANREYYGAHLETLDLDDPASIERINAWVAEQTENRITSLIDRPSGEIVLWLVNTVYFNAMWEDQFEPEHTRDELFHLDRQEVLDVPFMNQEGTFDYIEAGGLQAVRLRYSDSQTGLWVILPPLAAGADPRTALDEWIASLDEKHWSELTGAMGDYSAHDREGTISLPRFTTRYRTDPTSTLKQMGMVSAFEPLRADFTGLVSDPVDSLWIAEMAHETFLDVHEEGTEAAAGTAIGFGGFGFSEPAGGPFEMVVDRPFLIAIDHEIGGPLVFLGAIYDPR